MTRATPSPAPAMLTLLGEQVPADSRQARQLERRQRMTELVMAEGTMRIEDLTERFGVSLMTAHRDLDDLIARGLLRKSRGLVTAAPSGLAEASDVYRASQKTAEKAAIAREAAKLIEPGQAIFMDDSTTALQMVPYLSELAPLTVITNGLTLMGALRGQRDLTLIGLGGQLHNWCNAFLGRMTTGEVARLRADTVFLSMSAIDGDVVLHQFAEVVDVKRAMFDAAARRVLLTDHSKFGRRALHAMARIDEFDVVITDPGTPPEMREAIAAQGVEVIVAPL